MTAKLKKELDRVFSLWVRKSKADHAGYVCCVSCGVSKHWKELQAGHFISRNILALRWDERNVNPQCKGCNLFQKGNYPGYARWLIRTYGPDIIDDLFASKNKVKKMSPSDYAEEIEYYTDKLAGLEIGEL